MHILCDLEDNKCALLGKTLTKEGEFKDSAAHVIPSAIGGRLKPYGILSVKANGLLNTLVDNPTIDIFGPALGFFLALSRDSGVVKQAVVASTDGEQWRFAKDKAFIEPAKPTVQHTQLGEDERHIGFNGVIVLSV